MTSLSEEERVLEEQNPQFPHEEFYASLDLLKHYTPRENYGVFADWVWAKIKNHQWWSRDIFKQADASEPAFEHKEGCRLLAYFGDKGFASSVSQLLHTYRSKNTSSSKTFIDAVDYALNTMSGQVQFGLACTCVSGVIWDKFRLKSVENSEVQLKSSERHDNGISLSCFRSFKPDKVDYDTLIKQFPFGPVVKETTKSTNLNLFDRDKLRKYVILLSTFPFSHSVNNIYIDTTIAEAQLSNFCHNWRGDFVEEDSVLI